MIPRKPLTALFALSALIISAVAQSPAPHYVHLRFPKAVDTTGLQITYYLTGSFGGYGSDIRTAPNLRDFAVELAYEGKSASALKAIVYCPGYAIKTVSFPTFTAAISQGVDIHLDPLPQLRLSGKVLDLEQPDRYQIEVDYSAYWGNEFFGIADGWVRTFNIATTRVRDDGTFAILIPDFSRDPTINAYRNKGDIGFSLRDQKTGNLPYFLERIAPSGEKSVRVSLADRLDKDPLLLRSLKAR